jgi:hypothetical protein
MSDPSDPLNTGNRVPETGYRIPETGEMETESTPASGPSPEPDWKNELRRDFETWLASLDDIPETDGEEVDDAPDLYSFYEQFAAANSEWRKSNRRTAEAMSQWGETLARFESGLQPLRETTAQLLAAQPKEKEIPRAQCLMLVELFDRIQRLARAFATPPVASGSWWARRSDAAWRQAWEAQHQAIDILASHLDGLLRKAGVTRIETAGLLFDPTVMLAVAAEPDSTHPPQSVLEEVTAGYRRHDELLRPAHVIVSR